jgi:hypothetical protein
VPGLDREVKMAKDDTTQTTPQGAASTVALENLAESIAKATLRALDERQLAAGPGGTVHLPIGDGTTVLGIYIPPCKPGESYGLGGLPCHHHIILGIIIMPGLHKAIETAGTPGHATLR